MSEYLYTTPPIDRALGLRRHVMTTSMGVFGGWGYREIQVPLLHYFEALRPGLDDDQVERSFRFVDRGGNLMVLRPDVTPAIAQSFAQMRAPSLPFRVSYTHKVVRIERSFTTDELESYQIGVEHIGGDRLLADVEVLLVALEMLARLGLPDYQIIIADHQIARHLLRSSGAPRRMREEIRQALVARDADEVLAMLNRLGARAEFVEGILAMASLRGGAEQLEHLRRVFPGDRKLRERIDYLSELDAILGELGYGPHVSVELAELTGASYYSGIGFTIVSEGATRELGHGGRYDDLIRHYGEDTAAVGFSMSLEMIVQALNPQIGNAAEDDEGVVSIELDRNRPLIGLRHALERRRAGEHVRLDLDEGGGR